jgi:hypothetical protein
MIKIGQMNFDIKIIITFSILIHLIFLIFCKLYIFYKGFIIYITNDNLYK